MTPMEQGVALLGAGRFHEAVQVFGAVLRANPLAAEPRVGLSQACHGIGDPWAAAAWLSDACRIAPQRAELWLELVKFLMVQQREAELPPLLDAAVALHPDHVPLLTMQADLALRHRQYAKALPVYGHLSQLTPADRAVVLHHGYCLEMTGDVEPALAQYRRALALDPDFLEAHVDLAGLLWRLEDFDGALTHAQRAVALAPEHPYAVRILGTAYLNLNRTDEAETQLRLALALLPGFSLAEVDLAFTLLLAGKLEEGWEMYGRRWRDTERMKRPAFFQPALEWQGPAVQPLQGRSIAVYAEQGLGDVIQFIRYAKRLQQDGAMVHAIVQPELASLLEHSMPGVSCVVREGKVEVQHHVALLDLPMHYATTLANLPAQVHYLRSPQGKVDHWRDKLAPWAGSFKVGIAWSGSHAQVNNRNRAVKLSDLAPILDMPGVQCFSLQKGDGGVFTDVVPSPAKLVDFTGEWHDFTDSAAMLSNLDLVITVDTALAHLAGALAQQVWVILAPNADWRWLLDREDSPWYATMRLFRRAHGEPRAAQVARVTHALRAHIRDHEKKTAP
jgi:tetratricopeptide (TPR) repeat protein